jgi:hypothetical protein
MMNAECGAERGSAACAAASASSIQHSSFINQHFPMITITCTHCQAELTMDDAFAGGVCRCQHCGTIQTVPSHLKDNAAAAAGASASPKTLYQKGGAGGSRAGGDATEADGLSGLADAVASSGLRSQRLRSKPPVTHAGTHAATTTPAPALNYHSPASVAPAVRKGPPVALLAIIGVLLLAVIALVGYVMVGRSSSQPAVTGPGTKTPSKTPGQPPMPGVVSPDEDDDLDDTGTGPVLTGPSFGDLDLKGVPSVAYVLDRGRSSEEVLDSLKAAVYKSLGSIGPQARFQVVFWDNGSGAVAYPDKGLANATPDQVDAAIAKFEDVLPEGDTNIKAAIELAAAQNPAVIVIATGKGYFMDKSELAVMEKALAGKSAKVHTFVLGDNGRSEALDAISQKTGGQAFEVSLPKLRRYSDD